MNNLQLLVFEMPKSDKVFLVFMLLMPILFPLFGIPYVLGPWFSAIFIALFIGSTMLRSWAYKYHIKTKLDSQEVDISEENKQYYDNYFQAETNANNLRAVGIIVFCVNIILFLAQSAFIISTSALGWACWVLAQNYTTSASRNITKLVPVKNE